MPEKQTQVRAEGDWITVDAPELRVVDEKLWQAARSRMKATRASYIRDTKGKLHGRPTNGILAKYLLTGMLACSCGGSVTVRRSGRGHTSYFCLVNRTLGASVCANDLPVPMKELDSRIMSALSGQLLDEDVIAEAMTRAIRQHKGSNPGQQRAALAKKLGTVKKEVANITSAIATGVAKLPSLVEALKDRQREQEQIEGEIARLDTLTQVGEAKGTDHKKKLQAALVDWRRLLRISAGAS